MLEIQCPSCRERLSVPEHFAGRAGHCRQCGAPVRIPAGDDPSPVGKKLEPAESFYSPLEGTEGKNKDGSKRQQCVAQCATGELLRIMKPGEGKPGDRRLGFCRSTGHQVGYLQGELAEWVIAAQQANDWIEATVDKVTETSRRFKRTPRYGLDIVLRRYTGDVLPREGETARRFRAAHFPYDPQKESDGRLLARTAKDLAAIGPEPSNPLERHFRYHRLLKWYYSQRDRDEEALHLAILVCQMQIAMAQEARDALRQGPAKDKPLPRHGGFELLAIIREKQGLYEHAIDLCEQAKKQGWHHDWASRIERCEKKIVKRDASG